MTATALRKELKGYINSIPERKLIILKPLITEFAKPLYTIEPASLEECAMIDERVREYDLDPSSFEPLD